MLLNISVIFIIFKTDNLFIFIFKIYFYKITNKIFSSRTLYGLYFTFLPLDGTVNSNSGRSIFGKLILNSLCYYSGGIGPAGIESRFCPRFIFGTSIALYVNPTGRIITDCASVLSQRN